METSSKKFNDDLLTNLPFKLQEGEQLKFFEKDVSFTIKNDDDEELQYKDGFFILTTQKALWCSLTLKKGIFFHYPNAISHGYNKLTLVCLINYENDDGEEAYMGVFGNPEGELNIENEEKDPILNKIQTLESLNSVDDFVQIIGSYHVEFEFDIKNRSTLLDVFQIFSECSALNPDKNDQNNNNDNNFLNLLGINPEEMMNEEGDEEVGEYVENDEEEDEEQKNGGDMAFE